MANSARIEAQRANDQPRCANCGWWQGKAASAGRCDRHDATTLDMALCSAWRDGDVVADVLPPDDPLPDDVPRWVNE
jgi:hypothetical protein